MADLETSNGHGSVSLPGQKFVGLIMNVPPDYCVPGILRTLEPRDLAVVLDFAAKAYTVLCETRSEHKCNEVIQSAIAKEREEKERGVATMKAAHESEMKNMAAKLLQKDEELVAAVEIKRAMEAQIDQQVKAEVARTKEIIDRDANANDGGVR